jgi:hypothetical protein
MPFNEVCLTRVIAAVAKVIADVRPIAFNVSDSPVTSTLPPLPVIPTLTPTKQQAPPPPKGLSKLIHIFL